MDFWGGPHRPIGAFIFKGVVKTRKGPFRNFGGGSRPHGYKKLNPPFFENPWGKFPLF